MRGKVIPVLGFKGGVGKSTICNMAQSRIENSISLNIDIAQEAEEINYGDTIDLAKIFESDFTPEEIDAGGCTEKIISILQDDFKYVFLDMPGELTDEMIEALSLKQKDIDTIIVPITSGKRSEKTTLEMISTLYNNELIKNQKIIFIVNIYHTDEEYEKVKENILEYFKINNLEKNLKIFFSKLKYSKAIKTMEDERASIEKLKASNYIAYKTFEARVDAMITDIQTYIKE